ncbi:hypothetical protein [Streptomyces sp. NPDC051776]|uniref:DUF7848 domain-containing protein n=1 Tax=Streptomyces sp. NPDC051776 TaxID=3155414 RepID=UPI00341B4F78
MSPTIIRAADWTLSTETAEGAPREPLYEAECTMCGESSAATEGDRVGPEMWALKHTGANPEHRTYRALITSFWRVAPAPGNPLREEETATC